MEYRLIRKSSRKSLTEFQYITYLVTVNSKYRKEF